MPRVGIDDEEAVVGVEKTWLAASGNHYIKKLKPFPVAIFSLYTPLYISHTFDAGHTCLLCMR